MRKPERRGWKFNPQRALLAALGGVVTATGPGYLPAHSPELYAVGGLGLLVATGAALVGRRPAAPDRHSVSGVPAIEEMP
jgi:hypothetical protein